MDTGIEQISDQRFDPQAIAELIADLTDRPRERLWRCGAAAVSDAELIGLVLGTGVRGRPVLEVANDLVRSVGAIGALSRASSHELAQISGIGAARGARLAAAFELGRRAVERIQHCRTLRSADDVYRCLAPRLAGISQELFYVIGIDGQNRWLDTVEVGRGSLAHVDVEPREVFRPLIRMAAAGGVLAHNHPSGDPTPSREDCVVTCRMRQIGQLLGVPILDHVVIGGRAYRSMAEWLGTDF